MSSNSLTALDSIARIAKDHPPALAFSSEYARTVDAWQNELRTKLMELSGLSTLYAYWPLKVEVEDGATEELDGYTRQRIDVQTSPWYWMPCYVLKPAGKGPFQPLIALHGHGRGAIDVMGIAESPEDQAHIERLNYAYAVEAVKHGYIVFAPDKRGFGERKDPKNECVSLTTAAMVLGLSVIGLHTWDNQRLLDHIQTRSDCRRGPAACIGLSGGGGGTLWLSAIDHRIGAAVVSGHMGVFRHGRFAHICNAMPNLLRWADRADIAGLIAPRPLLIESGSHDECFPRDDMMDAYRQIERVYETCKAEDVLAIDCFDGPHRWSGRLAWDWLQQVLPS